MLTLVVVWRQEDTEWEYPRELLELGQVLGEGTFGKVVTGHAHNTQLKDDIPGWVESRARNEPSRIIITEKAPTRGIYCGLA